ncbi:MAG: hypothetical protein IJC66_10415, partial [Kiritimatiellae bacterium]|nr:hypothetical protein [Kiritimatiellia bacterium]
MNLKCCVFTAAACVSAAVFASESNIVLCERGKEANASIVLPEKAGPSIRYAAEELQRCIGKMTDVKLPIIEGKGKESGKTIRLIQTDEYGADGFRIRVKNGAVEIYGGRRGVLYGAFELLETYGGCGWYASWHEVIPRKDRFAVPSDLDDTQKP